MKTSRVHRPVGAPFGLSKGAAQASGEGLHGRARLVEEGVHVAAASLLIEGAVVVVFGVFDDRTASATAQVEGPHGARLGSVGPPRLTPEGQPRTERDQDVDRWMLHESIPQKVAQ